MERPILQISVATMLRLVACIALNFWLFRLGVFWGILGLNVTKHVMIAYLCGALGVDRRRSPHPNPALAAPAPVSDILPSPCQGEGWANFPCNAQG
jgi:hypothetical protein